MGSVLLFLLVMGQTGAAGSVEAIFEDPTSKLLGWLLRTKRASSLALPADEVGQSLKRGEAAHLDGGSRSAAALLGSLKLDPGFAKTPRSAQTDNILYDLAGALIREGAYGQARRVLLELLRTPGGSSFRAPAFRKLTDLTLESGQYEQSLTMLQSLPADLSTDEKDEAAYLKGKALAFLGFPAESARAFESVSRHSRFRAAALYMLGVLALEAGEVERAESRFCSIVHQPASGGQTGRFTFFVSDKTLDIIDHAWLALARIRHDRGEYPRAIDSYNQVRPGSPAHQQALYESAWSLFRSGRFVRARHQLEDLLDRNPHMADWPAANLLLGYSMLSECLFEPAMEVFRTLEKHLGTGAARRATLTAPELAAVPSGSRVATAISLGAGIHSTIQRVLSLRSTLARLASGLPQQPRPVPGADLNADLEADLSRARHLSSLLAEIGARSTPGDRAEIDLLSRQVREAAATARRARDALLVGQLGLAASDTSLVRDQDLPREYLTAEEAGLVKLGERLKALARSGDGFARAGRSRWKNRAARKVSGWARAAHIGKVDTVLARKQSLEIEVQNLAQGRYPLSLFTDLARAGLVDETMEYWPYDGEDWPDEMQ
jgi:tetratricopeptide (TPR) repeat protein